MKSKRNQEDGSVFYVLGDFNYGPFVKLVGQHLWGPLHFRGVTQNAVLLWVRTESLRGKCKIVALLGTVGDFHFL